MLPFGKKISVRNFVILKNTKTLKSGELKKLRNAQGIPADVQKHLQRGGIPYIKVSSVSGSWSVEFICGTVMYSFIDTRPILESPAGTILTKESEKSLHNLFVMMFADCTVLGDKEYLDAKADALQAFMNRQQASNISDEEDKKTLDELQSEAEAKDNLAELAAAATKKEGGEHE